MGRPKRTSEPVVWNVKLLLYEGEDDDLLALYRRTQPGRGAAAVKAAMRAGGISEVLEEVEGEEDVMAEALFGLLG